MPFTFAVDIKGHTRLLKQQIVGCKTMTTRTFFILSEKYNQ